MEEVGGKKKSWDVKMETGTADDRDGIPSLAHPQCGDKPTKKNQQKQHTNIKEKKIIKGFPGISTTFTDK